MNKSQDLTSKIRITKLKNVNVDELKNQENLKYSDKSDKSMDL